MRSLQLLGHKSGESKARGSLGALATWQLARSPGVTQPASHSVWGKQKKCRKGGGKAKEKRSQNGGRAQEK